MLTHGVVLTLCGDTLVAGKSNSGAQTTLTCSTQTTTVVANLKRTDAKNKVEQQLVRLLSV